MSSSRALTTVAPIARCIARCMRRRAVLSAALLLGGLAPRAEAVAVSPAALFLDARTRSGVLTLHNPGSLPEEIEVGFAFGYPTADSSGNVVVELVSDVAAGEPSLVPWMRAFPRRIRLEPGQRQVLRIMVNPPADLPAGEYWGRVTILSRGGLPPVEQRQGDVTMRIDLQTQVLVAVMYRNGAVQTGVEVSSADASPDSGRVRVRMDLARQGNAAYLGHVRAELLDRTGQTVAEVEEDIAVYRRIRRILQVPIPAGTTSLQGYRVRFTISTERPDLPVGGPIPATAVTGTVPVT